MNAEGSSISQGVSFAHERSIGSFVSSRERTRARTAWQMALFAARLVCQSLVDLLEYIRRADIQGIT